MGIDFVRNRNSVLNRRCECFFYIIALPDNNSIPLLFYRSLAQLKKIIHDVVRVHNLKTSISMASPRSKSPLTRGKSTIEDENLENVCTAYQSGTIFVYGKFY